MRRVRNARGLSVRALSERIGLLPSAITKIELDERTVTIGEACDIAKTLDVALSALVSDEAITIQLTGAAQDATGSEEWVNARMRDLDSAEMLRQQIRELRGPNANDEELLKIRTLIQKEAQKNV